LKECRKEDRVGPYEFLAVFDYLTNKPIGELVNLSNGGAMMITPGPIKSATLLMCRLKLAGQKMGCYEIIFKAECRWCRKNISTGMWESGYKLNVTGKNKEILSYLILSLKLGYWGNKNVTDVKTVEMDNRRKSNRYELNKPLPVFEHHNYRQLGELADLSTQGALLITKEPISVDDLLCYRVLLAKKVFKQDYMIFEAKCMWSRKGKDGDYYESGHKIVNISEKDAVISLHLMTNCSKKQQTKKRILIVN